MKIKERLIENEKTNKEFFQSSRIYSENIEKQ